MAVAWHALTLRLKGHVVITRVAGMGMHVFTSYYWIVKHAGAREVKYKISQVAGSVRPPTWTQCFD